MSLRRAADRRSGWRERGRRSSAPCRWAAVPPDRGMRRRETTASASVSWIVSSVRGEVAEAALHRIELAGHALLLRAERAERLARVGERRDRRVVLAERDHLGHELADLGLGAG